MVQVLVSLVEESDFPSSVIRLQHQ